MKKKKIETDILVIGGGLTGLCIAHLLRKSPLKVNIIEARNRLGGRIYTLEKNGEAKLEMGATWLGEKHKALQNLLQELEIGTFDQLIGNKAIYEAISTSPHYLAQLPPNPEPSMRIQGGSSQLIKALIQTIDQEYIALNQKVESIHQDQNRVQTDTADTTISSRIVVSTLPPKLFASNISVIPPLPERLSQIAHQTHTWMGESIKIALRYDQAFWRADHLSGTIMSNVGPIQEMYDHCNYEDNKFALKGFMNGNYYSLNKDERLEMILKQLIKYYGPIAKTFTSYEDTIWRNEEFTFSPYNMHILPHQNNGNVVYQKTYLDGKLLLSGTETASTFPGYMEGAIQSAIISVEKINNHLSDK